MKREEKLKEQLMEIREKDKLSKNINYYELSLEMMYFIGTIDPELRDKLIFNTLVRIIQEKMISNEEIEKILSLSLSDNHLFYGVGKVGDDSVFNRTFSVLIVDTIINMNNKEKDLLEDSKVLKAFEKVIKYAEEEKDYRGIIKDKGWAHSTAHTSDALCSFAESKVINIKELRRILEIMKEKICIDTYTYINEEDDRLVNIFMSIYNRDIINVDELISWMKEFKNLSFEGDIEKQEALRENVKLFFRSLYFRCSRKNVEKELIIAIEDVLDSLPAFY